MLAGMLAAALMLGQADELPEGKGKAETAGACGSCHGLENVTRNRFARAGWRPIVDDMMARAGTGTPAEQELIVGYLVRFFGKPIRINQAAEREIQDALALTSAQAQAIVKYRAEKGPFTDLAGVLKVPGVDGQTVLEMAANLVF